MELNLIATCQAAEMGLIWSLLRMKVLLITRISITLSVVLNLLIFA